MLFKKTLLASALLALGGFAVSATGATSPASASFQVKLKINKACSVNTSGALDLGTVDANSGSDVAQNASNINVKCSKTTAFKIGLTPNSSTSTDGTGQMAGTGGNTDKIAYALYQDNANTVWGNVAGTNTKNGTGDGTTQNFTVYGKVLSSSLNVAPDTYADTVSVDVTY